MEVGPQNWLRVLGSGLEDHFSDSSLRRNDYEISRFARYDGVCYRQEGGKGGRLAMSLINKLLHQQAPSLSQVHDSNRHLAAKRRDLFEVVMQQRTTFEQPLNAAGLEQHLNNY